MAKKRANGEGNIRKRKDGRWEGRYTAGRDPETGKAIYKNVLAKTQKIRPFHSEKLQKCKMKSERAKRVLIRSKTTQTTKPHRKFFVLILERADGQNVRHHHAENQL